MVMEFAMAQEPVDEIPNNTTVAAADLAVQDPATIKLRISFSTFFYHKGIPYENKTKKPKTFQNNH